jgi:hypothetical protein
MNVASAPEGPGLFREITSSGQVSYVLQLAFLTVFSYVCPSVSSRPRSHPTPLPVAPGTRTPGSTPDHELLAWFISPGRGGGPSWWWEGLDARHVAGLPR